MLIDEAYKYADNLINTDEFKKLVSLKKEIDKKYGSLIVSFKTKEANYLDALKYKDYYPNFKEIKQSFIDAKAELYKKEEVSKYFELERMLQEMINNDLAEVKMTISPDLLSNSRVCRKK